MSEQDRILPKRRNGKQQACEPCRKRKMACDHTLPICQRCRKRKDPSSCIYLPAPMTRNSNSQRDSQQSLPSLESPTGARPDAFPISSPAFKDYGTPVSLLSLPGSSFPDVTKVPSSALFTNPSGFMGPTSFSAVFHENRSRLEPTKSRGNSRNEESLNSDSIVVDESIECNTVGSAELESQLIRMGTKILGMIPDRTTCLILSERNIKANDGWLRPAVDYSIEQMFAMFGAYLADPQQHATMAKIIYTTARIPLQEPDEPKAWFDSFSGEKLRWEALGILFTAWGYGAMSSSDNDELFKGRRSRQQCILDMKECSSLCISLSGHTNCVNPLMVFLVYKNGAFETACAGDTSLLVWRQNGDLASLTTALGLHREADSGPTKVSIRSEMRRRIYASAFIIDKVLATFMGRPPALSGRYSACPMPLDISDEELIGGEPGLSNAVASLDPSGWNTRGDIFPTTILRERLLEAQIRDEVLEISLGGSTHRITERLDELKNRSAALLLSYPRVILWEWDDLIDPLISDFHIWIKLVARLEHLQNDFLLERLSIKHNQTSGQALVDIASEMLSLTLVLWTHRDRFEGRHHDYEWMIMYWGFPASGILCIELLKLSSPPSSQQHPASHLPLSLSRSTTIQNLSLFIGFLSWVKPNAPNSSLCFRIKGIITRVLDQLLEPPMPSQESVQSLGSYYNFDFIPGNVNYGEWDDFGVNFELLDTFDWLRAVQGD